MDRLRSDLRLSLNCSGSPLILLLLGRGAALGRPALLQEGVGSAAHNLLQEGRRQDNHRSLLLLLPLHRQGDNGSRLLLLRRQHWQGDMGPLLPSRRLHIGQEPSCQLHLVLIAVQVHSGGVHSHTHPTAPVSVLPAA